MSLPQRSWTSCGIFALGLQRFIIPDTDCPEICRISYGLSVKKEDKAIRTARAYVNNNPVEGRMCHRAEEWRWNFIAYADSKHPYSEKIMLSRASAGVRRAIKKVEYFRTAERPLLYDRLDELSGSADCQRETAADGFHYPEIFLHRLQPRRQFYMAFQKDDRRVLVQHRLWRDPTEPFDPESDRPTVR